MLSSLIRKKSDDIFLTALLQDIGIVIIYFCITDDYLRVLDESGLPMQVIENEIFGFNHQEVGAEILKHWGLPESIYKPINYHHQERDAPEEYATQANILAVSNNVSSAYHGKHSNEKIRKIKETPGNRFGIDDEAIDIYIDSVAEKSIEILSGFEIDLAT